MSSVRQGEQPGAGHGAVPVGHKDHGHQVAERNKSRKPRPGTRSDQRHDGWKRIEQKTHTEAFCWQQELEAVIHDITKKETLERELGIKFAELWGCEGAGGAATGGA